MKKISTFTVILIFCYVSALSQSCLPGQNNFNSQFQIDNFQIQNPGCTEIEGSLSIHGDITNLNGLNVVTSIGGTLLIAWANSLKDLSGLDNLTSVGGTLYVGVPWEWESKGGNDSLLSLDGLGNLTSIGQDLYIGRNLSLMNIEGLNTIETIGGSLIIEANESLSDLDGLESLIAIPENLIIGSFGGWKTLVCFGNPSLINLDGLSGLSSVGGDLSIYCNDSLMSLEGLANLMSISGKLNIGTIYENPWGTLYAGNPSIKTLIGLENIAANSIDTLNVVDNSSLTNCEVQSICDYLISLTGFANIHDNAPGCNSPEEVQDSCEAHVGLIDDRFIYSTLSLYPNPAYQEVNISTDDGQEIDEVRIYTLTGQQILKARPENGKVDISELQPGMYIVEVTIENTRVRQKLLIHR